MKINRICLFASIPCSVAGVLAFILGISRIISPALSTTCLIFFLIGFVLSVITTVTCGTLFNVIKMGAKAFLAVLRFPRIIVLHYMFFLVWLSVGAAALAFTITAGLFVPTPFIYYSIRKKERDLYYVMDSEAV